MQNKASPLLSLCYAAKTAVAAAGMTLALCLSAAIAGTTQEDVLQAQILPGWDQKQGQRMAAIQLDLAPGWKTYWRSPGNAGIPPQFDWSGSQNLKSVKLHWPSPSIFSTNGLTTLGYRQKLVLPIELEAIDPNQPITLSAQIEMGICLDICLPAEVKLHHELTPNRQRDPEINSALKLRPLTAREANLSKITCAFTPISDGVKVTARLRLPPNGLQEMVTIEAEDPAIWVSEADVHREGSELVALADLVAPSGQPFAVNRSGLTVTVISEKGAVEVHGCPS